MGKPSTIRKDKWNKKTYRTFVARLRYDDDKDLINYIEMNKGRYSVTDYLRAGLEVFMEDER